MMARITSSSLAAKSIRIVLVFALVFWASFRVESLAFGDVARDSLSAHGAGALDDMEICKVTGIADKPFDAVRKASDTAAGKNDKTLSLSSMQYLEIAAVPKWGDSATGSDRALGNGDLKWSVDGSCVELIADEGKNTVIVKGKAKGEATITCTLADEKYVSESFRKEHAGKGFKASFKVNVVNPEVASIELLKPDGEALAGDQTLSISAADRDSYAFGARVTVKDPITGDTVAVFTNKDRSTVGPPLSDLLSDFEWDLKSISGGAVDRDVASVDSDGVLHISQDAAFIVLCTIRLEGASSSVQVNVTSGNPQADGGSGSESGGSGENAPPADDGQGAWRPQRQLRVVASLPVSGSASGSAAIDSEHGEEGGDAEAGASNVTGADGNESQPGQVPGGASGDGPDGALSSTDTAGGSDGSENGTFGRFVDKLYSADDLEALGAGEAVFSMYGKNGWEIVRGRGPSLASLLADAGIDDTSQIESISFEGLYGTTEVAWSDLTAARSYYPRALAGDFDDGEPSSPMVAVLSYQYSPDELTNRMESNPASGSGGDADGSPDPEAGGSAAGDNAPNAANAPGPAGAEGSDGPELVDNTQFRLLFGATSPADTAIDPDALRWINTIRVNMKAEEDDSLADPKLRVRIGYVPVPLGYMSVFSAIPNNEIGNARFSFRWQESADGVTWVDVDEGSVQTLRVYTSEDLIGHWYRVIMETDLANDEGEMRGATSDPVAMQVGDGFAVQLAYDPPIAGNTAIFQSTVHGVTDASSVSYEWQSSVDGGETWTPVPNRTGPQLVLPTDPVEERPEGSADAPDATGDGNAKVNPVIYIRVIATAADGRQAYSNVMPLTVRVGESDDEESAGRQPGDSGTDAAGDPAIAEGEGQDADGVNAGPEPKVTEITQVVYEEPGSATVLGGGAPAPTSGPDPTVNESTAGEPAQQATAPQRTDAQAIVSDLYVNPEVSDQIREQVQAEREYATATTPGARWTEINAVNAGGDDVRRVLSSNPFAPFVLPLGMGIVAAGGLERFLSFRRQL